MDLQKALEKFFAKSRLPVLFAGAGVSARGGIPTWGSYLAKLGAAASEYDEYIKFMIDRAVAAGAFEDAASLYLMCRDMPESTKFKEMQAPLLEFNWEPIRSLVRLPFQSVVTTNFDRLLFSAYAKSVGQAAREVNIDDPALSGSIYSDDLYVARIHGRVEVPSSMRLSKEHFALLQANASYGAFLDHIFTKRQVLFVGFSFLDPAISAVLRSVRSKTASLHGQEHWALVPEGASAEFVKELELHSIRRIEYSPNNNHDALWLAIEDYVNGASVSHRKADVRELPFQTAKKYLATAFARSRLGRQREPLAQAMAEGVVSGILVAERRGLTESELGERLSKELAIDDEVARTLVARSVVELSRDGICGIVNDNDVVRYVSKHETRSVFDAAIDRLVDGAVQRYRLRERGSDSSEVRQFLARVLGELLLQRGWELGAAYAGRRMPEDVDLSSVMDRVSGGGVLPSQFSPLERSLKDLLLRPDDEEANLLADLGRTAFGLELLLEAPHDSLFVARALPERLYFDANVVMPAITSGHPLQKLFEETISSLRGAAGGAATGPSMRVYDGFLNEIVSHRRLAIEAMEANGGEGALWEERSVGLFGTANVNVYVGSYFNFKVDNKNISFRDFLHKVAPYETEGALRKHLEKLGFEVVREGQVEMLDVSGILHSLEKFNADKLEQQKKSPVVLRHDAVQLAIVNAELAAQKRSVLVSADRGIRLALEAGNYGSVANAILTHVGLTQLVELMVGRVAAPRGMASLLWMSPVSSDAERIRSHLISLALREHDVAFAMHLPDVVGDIAEDAGFELSRKKLKLDNESAADKVQISRILERYETDFFKKMNAEISKKKGNPPAD